MMVNLHELAGKGNTEDVYKYVRNSSSKVDKTNRDGQTALHCAARGGHATTCRHLLEAGARANAEDTKARTPTWVAVESNRPEAVRVLCEAGADTSRPGPEGRTPLHIAAKKGFLECADLLLRYGAIIDGNPDRWGKTPGDDCAVSEIRILIDTARRERAGTPWKYCPQTPSAPPLENPYPMGVLVAQQSQDMQSSGARAASSSYYSASDPPPSYQEAVSLTEFATSVNGNPWHVYSPASRAREATNLGGDRCAGCHAPERSRQLTPCLHVVCNACARRARHEGENTCPVCRGQVFDDNPLLA